MNGKYLKVGVLVCFVAAVVLWIVGRAVAEFDFPFWMVLAVTLFAGAVSNAIAGISGRSQPHLIFAAGLGVLSFVFAAISYDAVKWWMALAASLILIASLSIVRHVCSIKKWDAQ